MPQIDPPFPIIGNVYIADSNNHRIRKVTVSTGIITTIAGGSTNGYGGDDGAATSAAFNFPEGVAVDASGTITIPALCRAVAEYAAHLVMSLECRKLILHFQS